VVTLNKTRNIKEITDVVQKYCSKVFKTGKSVNFNIDTSV
jgi:hypothetical protein